MFVFKCAVCGHTEEVVSRDDPPTHCGSIMRRSYRDEHVGVSFKGSGWARKG